MSFLGGTFGGGSAKKASEQLREALQQAEAQERADTQQGLGLLSPFQQAGVGAIPQLQALFGQDPTDIINKIMGQFQESPAQQFQSERANQALQNQMAAAGLSGSGEAAQRSGQLAQQLASQGQQQFLQDVLGQRQQQISGLEGFFGGGLSAAGQGAGLLGQEGRSLTDLTGQIGAAQAAGTIGQGRERAGLFGGIGSLLGLGAGSGLFGGGGFGNLFGGSRTNPWLNPDTNRFI